MLADAYLSTIKLLVVLCLIALSAAASPQDVLVTKFDNDKQDNIGGFKYEYELSDGTMQESKGELKNEGRDDAFLSVSGSYSWVGPDGVTYLTRYTADENGYHPEVEQGPAGK